MFRKKKILVTLQKELQLEKKELVTGKDSKKEEDKNVVLLAFSVEVKTVEDYSKNVLGLEKLFGGLQKKNVHGKEKKKIQNKEIVVK